MAAVTIQARLHTAIVAIPRTQLPLTRDIGSMVRVEAAVRAVHIITTMTEITTVAKAATDRSILRGLPTKCLSGINFTDGFQRINLFC